MSLDSAKAFIEKMMSDEVFRNRVMAIEDIDARLAVASSEGFEFTETEFKEVQSELSDEEMEAAVGGALELGGVCSRYTSEWRGLRF